MNWKEIETKGTEKNNNEYNLGTNYQFNKLIFTSSKIGFLIGNYDNVIGKDNIASTAVNIDKLQDAIVLKTNDSGYNWKESILGKGEIVDFTKVDDHLIALRQSYHGQEANDIHSHLHVSTDQGETWQEVINNTQDQIDEIRFWTKEKGIGICGLKGYAYDEPKVIITNNSGKSWNELSLPYLHETMSFEVSNQGILYYLTEDGQNYIEVNLNLLKINIHPLEGTKELPFSLGLDNNDRLYFIAEDNAKMNIIYRMMQNGEFERIEFPIKDTMVNDAWIYDNVISIIVDKDGGSYYRSVDSGKTWNKEQLLSSFIRNIAFYGKDNIWIRTMPGKMIIRKQ